MSKNIFVSLLAVAVVGGGAFFGGMKYQESKSASASPAARNFQGMAGGAAADNGARASRNGNGGGMIAGEITAVDDDSITVKSADGASKIVFFSEKTSVGNFIAAQSGDLTVGQSVTATGTAGTDGSIVASNIQIGTSARQGGMPMPGASVNNERQEEPAVQPVM